MGYSQTIPLISFEVPSQVQPQYISFSDVVSDVNLALSIPVHPSYVGTMKYAYIDAYFPYVTNTSANTNMYDNSSYIQAEFNGTFHDAIHFISGTFYLAGNDSFYGTLRFFGTEELVSQGLNAATSITSFKWKDAKMLFNGIMIRNPYFVLRCYSE